VSVATQDTPEVDAPAPAGEPPVVSILIPCLNEQVVIGEFVDWCWEGLAKAGVSGEVVIVDSSSDRSPDIAEARGARVVRVPKRGLGRAYIDGIPHCRGKYVIMGDCDLTYDFRDLGPFVKKLDAGYEFVMGTRMKGSIDPGAMPPLHQYFGTPVTTWMLNRIYRTPFSDMHCGMRACTTAALKRMDLQSQSWQYASEMIIKAVQMGFRNTEVPIHFLKDREGRESHLKRTGWWAPWFAAWITLRAMFTFGADYFLYKPGLVMLTLGLLLVLPLSTGPIVIGPLGLSLHWMLAGMTLAALGLQCVFMGIVARVLYDYTGHQTERWMAVFEYDRAMIAATALAGLGVLATVPLIAVYVREGFALPPELGRPNYLAVTGLLSIIAAFLTFATTLLVHAVVAVKQRRNVQA